MTARLSHLSLPGSSDAWDSLVPDWLRSSDGRLGLRGPDLVWPEPPGEHLGWVFDAESGPAACDGIPVGYSPAGEVAGHSLGGLGYIDHIVITTDSIERTSAAIEALTGEGLRRIRETADVRQGFHRLGPGGTILELVERAGVATALWGFVLTVPDLDEVVAAGGDLVSPARDAVQPGRRIAAVDGRAGLGTAVAFMTPEPAA